MLHTSRRQRQSGSATGKAQAAPHRAPAAMGHHAGVGRFRRASSGQCKNEATARATCQTPLKLLGERGGWWSDSCGATALLRRPSAPQDNRPDKIRGEQAVWCLVWNGGSSTSARPPADMTGAALRAAWLPGCLYAWLPRCATGRCMQSSSSAQRPNDACRRARGRADSQSGGPPSAHSRKVGDLHRGIEAVLRDKDSASRTCSAMSPARNAEEKHGE